MPAVPTPAQAVFGVGAAGLLGLGYAAGVERHLFTLRRFQVPVLPPGSRPVRVLHVSDLHLVPRQHRKVEWLRGLAELRPDLVVGTGDYIAHQDAVATAVRAFEPLLHTPGVFVLGSNDYFSPVFKNPWFYLVDHKRRLGQSPRLPTAELVQGLEAGGWRHLRNRRTRLTLGEIELELVGVDDPHLDYDRLDLVDGPADPQVQLTVGVTHAPYRRVLDRMSADGAALLLAGHTHGGQLCLPFYGALVTNCDLDRSRAKGASRWGANMALHVSAGIGTSPYAPLRFCCRPEATLLTLVAAPTGGGHVGSHAGTSSPTVSAR